MYSYNQILAAICLWREGRGQSKAALTAIYHVILNRVADQKNRWPKTISGVIMQPAQFSSMTSGSDPNLQKMPVDNGSPDWLAFQDCLAVVETALIADPTQGATNYISVDSQGRIPPSAKGWATAENLTYQIGSFRFFRL